MISTLHARTGSRRLSISLAVALCTAAFQIAVPGPASAALCATDVVPAATLLLPYFEVDLESCENPFGEVYTTTRFSIVNTGADPVLAHVTLWSNVGIPFFAFDVYLAGHDTQRIDLGDLLCDGWLPTTGPGFTALGPTSSPHVAYPGCNNGGEVGAAPAYGGVGAVDAAQLADLQAAFTGQPVPSLGEPRCVGYDAYGDGVARGSVTVDLVTGCTERLPSDPEYLGTELEHENLLTGTWEIVSEANNFAIGTPLVHLEADTAGTTFASGDVTFYGRFTSGAAIDRREPLPTTWAARALLGGAFSGGTDLLVWRESPVISEGSFYCWILPPDFPLDHSNSTGWGPLIAFDETSQAEPVPSPPSLPGEPEPEVWPFPFAAQSTRVMVGDPGGFWPWLEMPTPYQFGWLYLNLQQSSLPWRPDHGQSWVTTRMDAEGRFSGGVQAFPLDSSCTCAPFDEAPAPMVVDNPGLVGGLFSDGFESGDTTRWSTAIP